MTTASQQRTVCRSECRMIQRREDELKVWSFSLGVTMMDGIRSENISATAPVKRCGDKTTEVRRFGHVERRKSDGEGC